MDCFDLVSADFKVENFVRVDTTLLDQSMSAHNDEEFPLGVVPMLSFGDAWFADVDAYLTAVQSMDELCERASVVDIHLERECDLLFWQIAQVCAVELLCKGVLWDLWDHEGLWLVGEGVD